MNDPLHPLRPGIRPRQVGDADLDTLPAPEGLQGTLQRLSERFPTVDHRALHDGHPRPRLQISAFPGSPGAPSWARGPGERKLLHPESDSYFLAGFSSVSIKMAPIFQ